MLPNPQNSVVVVPTCHRPEFLALCLRRLSETYGLPEVHIYADTAANLNHVEYVRDTYLPQATIFEAKPHIEVSSGCWNILTSIKEGSRFAKNVFLVEEDVMVFPGFFLWHYSQDAPASCGRRIPRYPWYTNPGSCLRRPLLEKLVPHVCDKYFRDTDAYCREHFPEMEFSSTLDDGLIRRVIRENDFVWASPVNPVCAHQGFRGYNRYMNYMNYETTIEGRIKRLEEIIRGLTVSPDLRDARDFEF